MAGLDLSSLVSEALGTADTIGQSIGQISQISGALDSVAEDKIRADRSAAGAASTIVEADLMNKAQQEATRKSIAARLGTDATQAGWIIGKASDQIAAADAELAKHSELIRQKDSISFIDDPLGWIGAQATINSDIANYNAAARSKNAAEDTAAQRAAMTTAAYANNDALGSAISQSYIDSAKIIQSHQYNIAASEATAQALRWNLEGIQAATNAGRDRLQVLFGANSAQMQEKQYQAEMQRLAMHKAEFNLKVQAQKEKLDEDSLILKYIQKGHFNLNGAQMEGARAKDALILYKAKEPNTMAYFESGLDSFAISQGGEKSVVSLSPFTASTLIAQGKVRNLPPAQTQVGEKLVEWRREFDSPAVQAQAGLDKKDKTSYERAFNAFVDSKKKQELGNVRPDSVFAPANIKQVAAVNKYVSDLPVWNKVLGPAAATGVDVNDPNIAFGIVSSAMREGKIDYGDALQLTQVYAAGLDLNNQSRNFIAMGVSPVKTYNSSVSVPGALGRTTVNMVDYRALGTALNKSEASRLQMTNRGSFGPLN